MPPFHNPVEPILKPSKPAQTVQKRTNPPKPPETTRKRANRPNNPKTDKVPPFRNGTVQHPNIHRNIHRNIRPPDGPFRSKGPWRPQPPAAASSPAGNGAVLERNLVSDGPRQRQSMRMNRMHAMMRMNAMDRMMRMMHSHATADSQQMLCMRCAFRCAFACAGR